jgi:hypothetical protein
MKDSEVRAICEESGMDYSRLSEKDKQAVRNYIAAYLSSPSSLKEEDIIHIRQKAYLAVAQDRMRRVDEWLAKQQGLEE